MAKKPAGGGGKGGGKPPIKPKENPDIVKIAAEGLKRPSALPAADVQRLAGEVMRQKEPRKGGKP